MVWVGWIEVAAGKSSEDEGSDLGDVLAAGFVLFLCGERVAVEVEKRDGMEAIASSRYTEVNLLQKHHRLSVLPQEPCRDLVGPHSILTRVSPSLRALFFKVVSRTPFL